MQEENERLQDELEDLRSRNHYLETLLKETYHRTKNHLSVLMSALSYRSRFCSSEASDVLGEARTMVMSVVTLNELLGRSGSNQHISAQRYLTQLAGKVFAICHRARAGIDLELEVNDIELDPSILLSCGMVINELIINAFKHAFPDGKEGTITVFLCCKGQEEVRLGVRDNGMGALSSSTESMGFELVRVLSKQLGGSFDVRYDHGTECIVTFTP